MHALSRRIGALSHNARVRAAVGGLPAIRSVVRRFVAGETAADAVVAGRDLRATGAQITLDHLGEDIGDAAAAGAAVRAYLDLLTALDAAGLAAGAELSVKLSAIGGALPGPGERYALDGALSIVQAAYRVGARVTLDMEDHTTVDATLRTLGALRAAQPDVGVAIQAMLRRTETDLARLTGTGSRVRLVKGAYGEPVDVAHRGAHEIDRAYVRAVRTLMAGDGYPMIATHDPRLIAIAAVLADRAGRGPHDWEHQLLRGVRPDERRRLVAAGRTVRVYVPYGPDWYGYFTRRIAERPADLLLVLRALASRR